MSHLCTLLLSVFTQIKVKACQLFFFCSHKLPAPITNNTSTDFKPTCESPQKPMCFPIYLFISTKATSFTHTPTMKRNINGVISSQRCCTTTKTFIQKVTRLHKRETTISLLIYIQNICLKDTAIKGQYI